MPTAPGEPPAAASAGQPHGPESPARQATGPTGATGDMHTPTRYGILGGTFDPPHIGHLIVAQEAYARLGLDLVWFLPAGQPPHKPDRPVTPAASRIAMVEQAIAGDARFALSRVELDRLGPSYTVETLRLLRAQWGPSVELFFVLGWDMLLYLPHWRDPAGVVAALDGLVAVPRPGFVADAQAVQQLKGAIPGLRERLILTPMPQVGISSTDIRQRVALGLPIQYLVPDTVRQYIGQQGLYRSLQEQPPQAAPTASARGEETA